MLILVTHKPKQYNTLLQSTKCLCDIQHCISYT